MNRFFATMAMFAICLPLVSMLAAPAQAQNELTDNLRKTLEVDPETSFWLSVAYTRNAAELEYYLAQYPDGKYAEVARKKLDYLDHNFRNSSLLNMQNYLESYPDGRYAGVAMERIAMEREQMETERRNFTKLAWFLLLLLVPVAIWATVARNKYHKMA